MSVSQQVATHTYSDMQQGGKKYDKQNLNKNFNRFIKIMLILT